MDSNWTSLPRPSSAQRLDVQLRHAKHGLPDPRVPGRVGIRQQGIHLARHDLPGRAETVLEPTASQRLAALGQPIPDAVQRFAKLFRGTIDG